MALNQSPSAIIQGGSGGLGLFVPTVTAGYVKTDASGNISISAAGSAAQYNMTAQTTAYSAAANDFVTASSASFTITLPTAVGVSGQSIGVYHNGTSLTQVYTINTTSSQTITYNGVANASGAIALYTNSEIFIFTSNGANWVVSEHVATTSEAVSTALFISSTSAYTFTITSATVVAGDVYTNNSQSFVVTSSGTVTSMPTSGTGAPAASGTLTRTSGTGPATLTFSAVATSAPVKGTTTFDNFIWWRTGQYLNFRYDAQWAASGGTAGSGDYRIFYPTNLAPNLTNAQTNPGTGIPTKKTMFGQGIWSDVTNSTVQVGYLMSANSIAMSLYVQATGMWGAIGPFGNEIDFSIQGRYPVTGWLP